MEIFTSVPGFVYLEGIKFNTLINEKESGKEKRRNKWPSGTINNVTMGYGKRTYRLVYRALSQTEYNTILIFFSSRMGMKEAFYWENFNESPITYIYPSNIIVDNDYSSEDTTTLAHYPIIGGTQTIYDDAVALTEGVDYSIVDTTGVTTWINKPAATSVITATYRFYREVRFDADELSPARKAYQVYDLDIMVTEHQPRL